MQIPWVLHFLSDLKYANIFPCLGECDLFKYPLKARSSQSLKIFFTKSLNWDCGVLNEALLINSQVRFTTVSLSYQEWNKYPVFLLKIWFLVNRTCHTLVEGQLKLRIPLSTKRDYIFGQSTAGYCRIHQKLSWGWYSPFKELQ